MTTRWFIRHNETPPNLARVLLPAATPLIKPGAVHANALARRLAA